MFYPMYMTSRRPMRIETVDQQYVLTDGVRIVERHPAGAATRAGHAGGISAEGKLLLNADLYSPPAQGAAPPAMPSAAARSLAQTIQRLKLDVAQHVPVHGRVGTHDEFMKMVSAKTE